ncbi:MAG: hypothetical protein EPN60_01590 [Nevskiaceae bacterium]|nr:MAG: hypothetical protein EPO48_01475 [Nevskiaceae bacterium]TAM33350.1 MAG: hypothetical protein EPN60_01590 [Nevskiaceae bacterium]
MRGAWLLGVAVLSGLLAACVQSADPATAAGASSHAPQASAAELPRDCVWLLRSDANLLNILYPDRAATYWVAALPIPPGGELWLVGRYPHARYASFNLYNPRLEPSDALADVEIAPQPGSVQPFAVGARRDAGARDYRVRVIAAVPPQNPAQREPNTLYSFLAAGEQRLPSPLAVVIYRVYVEDAGYDLSGGVGLPQVALPLAGGAVLRGSEACSALERLPTVPAAALLNGLDPPVEIQPNLAAFPELRWLKFFDLLSSQSHRLDAVPLLGPLLSGALGQSTSNSGGFASNVHNSYMTASLSQSLGEVGVLVARMPTTPQTRDGEPVMGDGQLRYWSLCSNEVNSQRYIDCLYDEQVQRVQGERAIILVSRAQDRPANAIAECGVNWLNWGPFSNSLLIYRHMLPRGEFAEAIQNIPGPSGAHEREVLGAYYPEGRHYGRAEFERLGCPVNPDAVLAATGAP